MGIRRNMTLCIYIYHDLSSSHIEAANLWPNHIFESWRSRHIPAACLYIYLSSGSVPPNPLITSCHDHITILDTFLTYINDHTPLITSCHGNINILDTFLTYINDHTSLITSCHGNINILDTCLTCINTHSYLTSG